MESPKSKHLGTYGALLSVTEIGLGSILHVFYIPFAGHFLSLNQGFLLTQALRKAAPEQKIFLLPTHISNIGALLKSLSPAGKKLTPMLALTAQGYLYSIGILLFGPTFLGFLVGMTLLSLWAFAQPVLIYYLIFGKALFSSYSYLLETLNKYPQLREEFLLALLLSVVAIKVLLSWIIVIVIYFSNEKMPSTWFAKLEAIATATVAPRARASNKFTAGLKGLTHPLFIVSLMISIGFFIFAENKDNHLFWVVARPLAVAFLIHFLFQFLPIEKWVKQLGRRDSSFANALAIAISSLKRPQKRDH